MNIDVFARSESTELLCTRILRLTATDADRIAATLGDLPLALAQAASYLADTGMSVDQYLSALNERTAELLSQGTPPTYSVSLFASYQLTLMRLAEQSPTSLDLLALAAHLAPEPIPFTLLTAHVQELTGPLATAAADPLAFAELTGC